jgi:hypothetical protein
MGKVGVKFRSYVGDDGEDRQEISMDLSPVVVMVEGTIAESLSEVCSIVEDFKEFLGDKRAENPERVAKEVDATYHAVRYSVENGHDLCMTAPQKDLRPKQRDCLIIMRSFIRRMADNGINDESFDDKTFISDCIEWMTATHFCLLEQVKRSDRRAVKRAFRGRNDIPFIQSSVVA